MGAIRGGLLLSILVLAGCTSPDEPGGDSDSGLQGDSSSIEDGAAQDGSVRDSAANDGSAQDDASVDSGGDAACPVGYVGPDCSACDTGYYEFPAESGACIDDECDPDPCNDHGTCDNSAGAGSCTCDGNFGGPSCDVCKTGWSGAACDSCATGYTGEDCDGCASGYYEYPASSGICIDDGCDPDPCNGHGTCDNSGGSADCTCTGNWAEPTCATCVAGWTGADCDMCNTGYTGASCDECDTGYFEYPSGSGTCVDDPCDPDVCNGHGACSNTTGAAVCTCDGNWASPTCSSCKTGYTGASCMSCAGGYYEYPASSGLCVDNPCSPDPCNGHGTCDNSTGAGVCSCNGNWAAPTCSTCVVGYTGASCMTNIDECSPNPCKNAGTCADGINAYTCTCKAAWTGDTCEDVQGVLSDTIANCHEEDFLDLSLWLPDPNASYADPAVTFSCSGGYMSVTSNSIPPYKLDTGYHTALAITTVTYKFPITPTYSATAYMSTVVGGVGVAINGQQISNPSASGGPLKYADPTFIEADGDSCLGHPNPSGKYHYHALKSSCILKKTQNGPLGGGTCTAPSPTIGYLYDGYPMKGPCECLDAACTTVVEMRSSYILEGGDDDPSECAYQDYTYDGDANEGTDGDAYLDECNGHYGPNGDYHYHSTNEYPWTTRCWHGIPYINMSTGGALYDNSNPNPKPDATFECRCVDGEYQSGASC